MGEIEVFIEFTAEVDRDLFSAAIQLAEGDFSHARCRYQNAKGEWRIFHSTTIGTVDEPADKYGKTDRVIRCYRVPLTCTAEQFYGWVARRTSSKIPYSFKQLVNQIARVLGKTRPIFRNGNSEMICCEEMFLLLSLSPVDHLLIQYDQDMIGLQQLQRFMELNLERAGEEEFKVLPVGFQN